MRPPAPCIAERDAHNRRDEEVPNVRRSSMVSDSSIDRVRAEQIAVLYRGAPVGFLGALVTAIVLGGMLHHGGGESLTVLVVWLSLFVAEVAGYLLLRHRYWRSASRDADWRRWAHAFTAVSVVVGLTWGVGSVWLIGSGYARHEYLIVLVVAGVASGSVAAFGSYLPAVYAVLVPALTPYLAWNLVQGGAQHYAMAFLDLVLMCVLIAVARSSNGNLVTSLKLRFENLELIESLRRQKEIAEQTNLAKSRFLASASHDLRQPVHALGMFVSALRERTMDAEARRLVDHIDSSVDAMDGLFSALLDISRLDAGVVQCRPESFPIQPLLERVCRDHAGEAQAKDVRLVLHRCSAIVHSDPVLLERIVRNLVANATRYTDRGRIVVGCRRGAGLRVQVWDTGRGIPIEQQERVFEEFYQLDNPERDRVKGLGLGLAIVKRLSTLLECPLVLESEPGKGSMFGISLPLADVQGLPLAAALELPASPLARGLILVVDDEMAIQEAMRSLLSGWGHEVIVAGSCAQMLERLATCATRPNLIICDYRLRDHENGIAVVRRLQSEFNADIPALLITGDTAPERLQEAQESGFFLLHKPVANAKLRAAIGNLIQSAPGD
jgi:signal transduction histidine kinase